MTGEELKKIQTPLKEKYANDGASALITLKAKGRIGENVSCKIETGLQISEAGLHPATGGTGLQLCSGDMLLEALIACTGVTLSAVATSLGILLEDCIIKAEGDLDFRGTLGISKEVPVGFKQIRLTFEIKSNETEEKIQTLLKLTERYCVVYQTLINSTQVKAKIINL
ncbi:OsmC family protein [Flavobacterium sp. SM15]|uniref:OsmC family protein n=1 Tax=Flavobacterium sp. SM15 TaxID=2908005 RepID=UPI001EDAAA8C|nr:OsmC family protein [Flavobacterium sp. SM15]MCG2611023.1 OsmC family protein [Flavobacterium sp. SM15]